MSKSISDIIHPLQVQLGRLEAFILLSHAIGRPKEFLIAHDEYVLTDKESQLLNKLVEQRLAGIPIAYITGKQEFFGRDFLVTKDTLIPRPDTELIVEEALKLTGKNSCSVLDLGTGSGCIAISMYCENPLLNITATDFSPKALKIARENALRLNAKINFLCGNWFDALNPDQKFDVIVSNPPYIESNDKHLKNLRFEPISALTDGFDGLQDLKKIIELSPKHLNKGGVLLLEHGWNQGLAVREMFDTNLWHSVKTIKDLGNCDRVTLAYRTQ